MTVYSTFPYQSNTWVRDEDWWTGTWHAMSHWCSESFGRSSEEWEFIDNRFRFKRQSDLVLFMLRWT